MKNKSIIKAITVLSACLLCVLAVHTASAEKAHIKSLVEGNNAFAVDLYARLMEQDGNLFFSPYSISTALGMVYGGAKGQTEAEMGKAMRFELPQDQLHTSFSALIDSLNKATGQDGIEINTANALWAQKGYAFRKEYLELLKGFYQAQATELDFKTAPEESRNIINRWVEDMTKERIKNLLPQGVINDLTRLVLTNAIYFKGKWMDEFDPDLTEEQAFYLADDSEIKHPLMTRTGMYGYAKHEGLQVLEMPYKEAKLSMLILLPEKAGGITGLEKEINPEKLTGWLRTGRARKVHVTIPKFSMTSTFNLNDALRKLGMKEAFSPEADLSGMTGRKELYITAVVHKAWVEVNEEGTEAAAATGVVVGITSIAPVDDPPVFRADHPFIFVIRDNNTGSILFMGRVMNPEE